MADELRFRRRLTDSEMDTVAAVVKARGAKEGFIALWDVILGEAEGMTFREAGAAGARFNVSDYAIPADQSAALSKLMKAKAGSKHRRLQVAMTFFGLGPAVFDDGPT